MKRKRNKMSNGRRKPLNEGTVKKGGQNPPPSRPKPMTPPPSQTPKKTELRRLTRLLKKIGALFF